MPTPEPAGPAGKRSRDLRSWISVAFTRVEDVVYVGLGLLLTLSAVSLLGASAVSVVRDLADGTLPGRVVALLDQLLLVLMIVEVLYTVQISFREHALVPEPFLIVGLIAVTRRILVLTAEFAELTQRGGSAFRHAMIELALLTVMVLVLVAALVLLRRRAPQAAADRA
jgi:uncharacterized membrane protein (DUF373 family)